MPCSSPPKAFLGSIEPTCICVLICQQYTYTCNSGVPPGCQCTTTASRREQVVYAAGSAITLCILACSRSSDTRRRNDGRH